MPSRPRSSSRRTTGLLVAAAFALIAAGVVVFIAFANRSGPQAPAVPANVVDIGKAPDASADGSIQQTGASRIQFADKQDASRLASELSYDKLDPVGQGYFALAQPRAWIYLRDGRTLHIRADSGRVKMPSRQSQPESGEFRGKVVVRMFPPAPGAKPINPDTDAPALLAVTESMNFDSLLMELQTSDALTISTPQVLFNGDGMLVRFNQVHERIELLRTTGKFIRYNPTLKDKGPTGPTSPSGTGVSAGPPAIASRSTNTGASSNQPTNPSTSTLVPPTPPRETLYRALFSDNLTVTETTRTLTADTLEVFARTLDNKLPENAFGIWPDGPGGTGPGGTGVSEGPPVIENGGKPKGAPATAHAAPSNPPASPSPNPYPPLFISADDRDIVLTWTGQLVLTPILSDTPPVELSRNNHFAARFSADKPGAHTSVAINDTQNNARANCAQIEYAATTRTLAFLSGPAAPAVTLDAPGSGYIEVPNFKIDLGTGISQITGAGLIASERPTPPSSDSTLPGTRANRQITWTDQADIVFRTERNRLTAALASAAFTGHALARDQVSMIRGDFLRAEFIPAGKQPTAISRVHVEGNVIGVAGTRSDLASERALPPIDPYLSADTLDVGFIVSPTNPNETEPARAVATGGARAATRDAWITADNLEATLGRDKRETFTATGLTATGAVHFERTDGVIARADRLIANPLTRTADLDGQVVALSRDNSTIVGKQMHLAETENASGGPGSGMLRVHGAGSFEHTQPSASSSDATRITATWTKSLTFDNASGLIETDGDSTVIAESTLSTQTARSSRLLLHLTPAGETPTPATQTASADSMSLSASGTGDRRLLKAEALGAVLEKEGAANATIEVRRYSPPATGATERILDQVMYIEGPRIIADDVAGTVSVPAAGRAIVRDQRTAPATTTEPTLANTTAPASPLPSTTRGTSRFTWAESMLFTRSSGLLSMKKDVELVHLPLGSEQAIRLVAMQLDAWFNIHTSGSSNTADLTRAEAIGAVYAEFAQQKLLADRFNYDALNSTAEASADPGNRVTLYDEKKGPVVARKLFWDLKNDRIEITEPAPLTTIR